MAALLGLFWRLLREGRLKVARGRSWQPEIGMEHASRGRRSGNKGVGARWRGRFRIFSARHCSRTKVSHAENSGMTMLFFSWRLLRCRRGILSHPLTWHLLRFAGVLDVREGFGVLFGNGAAAGGYLRPFQSVPPDDSRGRNKPVTDSRNSEVRSQPKQI